MNDTTTTTTLSTGLFSISLQWKTQLQEALREWRSRSIRFFVEYFGWFIRRYSAGLAVNRPDIAKDGQFTISQGTKLGRQSRIKVAHQQDAGKVWIGGHATICISGKVTIWIWSQRISYWQGNLARIGSELASGEGFFGPLSIACFVSIASLNFSQAGTSSSKPLVYCEEYGKHASLLSMNAHSLRGTAV